MSNLEESEDALKILGNFTGTDVRFAQGFTSGPDTRGYMLDTITIDFGPNIGTPADFVIALYSEAMSDPETLLATLTGPNPTTVGTHHFSSPAETSPLSSNTTYFAVMHADGAPLGNTYTIRDTTSTNQSSPDAWSIGDNYLQSTDGGTTWSHLPLPIRMSIQATPVPEPQRAFIAALSFLIGWILRQRYLNRLTGRSHRMVSHQLSHAVN